MKTFMSEVRKARKVARKTGDLHAYGDTVMQLVRKYVRADRY